ncbi:Josephin-1, partial [Entomortierella beljakovae]
MGAGNFTRPTTLNQPIKMQPNPSYPAITIYPGDYIVADADGVVVIPKDLLSQVEAQCKKSIAIDDQCMAALNSGAESSVLQGPIFSTADLDVIAEDLRRLAQENLQRSMWRNPYKSPLGMGYYDVSVLEAALIKQKCTLSWFDARRDIGQCLSQQDDSMVGLIAHVPTIGRWIPFWKGQHWFGILRLSNGAFIDMDSRLLQPVPFEGFDEAIKYLDSILKNNGRLFLIHKSTESQSSDEIDSNMTSTQAAPTSTTKPEP